MIPSLHGTQLGVGAGSGGMHHVICYKVLEWLLALKYQEHGWPFISINEEDIIPTLLLFFSYTCIYSNIIHTDSGLLPTSGQIPLTSGNSDWQKWDLHCIHIH